MNARTIDLVLPAGAGAMAAFAAPSNPVPTACPALPVCQAGAQRPRPPDPLVALAAEAGASWGSGGQPAHAPPASLDEARALRDALANLMSRERAAAADFLVALSDFDAKRGWEALGHASLFAFLTRELRLSSAAAFARLSAARLVGRFPEVEAALRDGRLCATSTGELAKVLSERNLKEVLPRFFGRSSREAKEIVAELLPRPAPRSPVLVTRLATLSSPRLVLPDCVVRAPEQHIRGVEASALEATREPPAQPALGVGQRSAASEDAVVHGPTEGEAVRPGSSGPAPAAVEPEATQGVEVQLVRLAVAGSGFAPAPAASFAEAPSAGWPVPSTVEPLSAGLRRLHLTVRTGFLDKLRAAKRGMAHARPGASLEEVLEAALDLLLEKQARRRGEVARPRKPRAEETAPTPAFLQARAEADLVGICDPPASPTDLADATIPAGASTEAAKGVRSATAPMDRTDASPRASRHVPAAVRREVWARDGQRCQFPLDAGGVCGSDHRLELDHVVPLALGGESTAANLRVTCRIHNQAAALAVLGDARMADRGRPRPARPATGRGGSG